ncbi:MAG: hypothetical protein MUC63_02390, partial [Planctomycetes bacterium]|nr:hypothetical protein [Planctomycetota bacterium]
SEEALRARLEQGDRPGGPGRAPAPPAPPDARARQEGMLLEALLGDPALAERARAEWPPERVRDAALRAAMEKVLGICEGAGRPALTQLIEGEPQGAMAEVAERILDREQRELVVDFRALWEGAVQALEALERRAKREEIKRALRDPGTEADPERRREMLRSLHRTC